MAAYSTLFFYFYKGYFTMKSIGIEKSWNSIIFYHDLLSSEGEMKKWNL